MLLFYYLFFELNIINKEERNTYNIYTKNDKFTECNNNEELFFVLQY